MVVWNYSIAPREGTVPSDNDWVYKKDLYIWRPGATKADHRPVMDSEDKSVSGPSLVEILNELGAEGWELIDTQQTGSVVGKTLGWYEGSYPISSTRTFRRSLKGPAA